MKPLIFSISSIGQDRRVRFLIAGSAAAGVNWLVRFPLNVVMPFGAAVISATAIGMVFGFVTYRRYVFPEASRGIRVQIRDFTAVNIAGMITTALVALAVRDYVVAPLHVTFAANASSHACGIAAGAIANYLGHANVTFRKAA